MVTGGSGRAPDPAAVIVGSGRDVFGRPQRRWRRERADWLGRYLPDSPGRDWSRCRVLDVSTSGAGLELLGPTATVGDRIVVDLQLLRSTMARVTLTGEVRDVGATGASVRVGVRFVEMGELEVVLLRRLVARQKHERRHAGVIVPLITSRAFD
jgi:hypothetical protein